MCKKRFILLMVIMVLIIAFIGCQPTPEEQVVIEKDNFENLIGNTPKVSDTENQDLQNIDSPLEHITWSETKQKITKTPEFGDITLNINVSVDSKVDLSEKVAPVYIVEPTEYELDFVNNAVNYFFNGDYYGATRTKDDYLIKILPLENIISTIDKRTKSSAEYYITKWKEKYNSAPETNKEGQIVFDKGYYDIVCLKGYPYEGAISEFYVQNGGIGSTLLYYYVDDVKKYYGETRYEYTGEPAIGMYTSYEDSEQLATDAVHKIYAQNMMLVQTTLANRGSLDEKWCSILSSKIGKEEFGIREQAYIFYFTRTYNGIPQLYAPKASNNDNLESEYGGYAYEKSWDYEYSMKWPAEYVMVIVDDTGIVEFWGFSPTKTTETVNENVAMLSFNEIFDKFKQNIYFNSIWADAYTEELKIHITDINFGMMRVPKKDNPNVYYMIPAWQFVGTKSIYSSLLPPDASYEETGKTFMVLNALDGSIIDTSFYENKRLEALKTMGEQEYVNQLDVIPPPN